MVLEALWLAGGVDYLVEQAQKVAQRVHGPFLYPYFGNSLKQCPAAIRAGQVVIAWELAP